MKSILLLVAILSLCVSAQAQFSNKLFTLVFDYPREELTNTTFRAYSSTDLAMPVIVWPEVELNWITESVTNGTSTLASSNKVLATAPVQYFVVSASNEWGLVFSDVLATRPPRQNVQLRLR